MAKANFVPAAGRFGATALYDPIVALTMREQTFRRLLVEQVAADRPATIVELGCGTGSLTVALARALPASSLTGLDLDPDALARARVKDPSDSIEWICAGATELPIADASIDCVVCSLVLHHLTTAEKRKALSEARRVLRDGGRLQIADWGKPQDVLMQVAFSALRALDGFERTAAHARGQLPSMIEQAGFGEVRRRATLRTGWGTLELISAVRA
jgi:ubiquinone/menaquinone biosynthesis C-methylase UbiE